jgi:hypothetical protein
LSGSAVECRSFGTALQELFCWQKFGPFFSIYPRFSCFFSVVSRSKRLSNAAFGILTDFRGTAFLIFFALSRPKNNNFGPVFHSANLLPQLIISERRGLIPSFKSLLAQKRQEGAQLSRNSSNDTESDAAARVIARS